MSKLRHFKDFGIFLASVSHPDLWFYVTLYVEISIYVSNSSHGTNLEIITLANNLSGYLLTLGLFKGPKNSIHHILLTYR